MQGLKERWKLNSMTDVWIVLLVFALTGTTVVFLKKPVVHFFTGGDEASTVFTVAYYILILPVYNVILLVYGALFGKFSFFWEFEKKTFRRMFKRKAK